MLYRFDDHSLVEEEEEEKRIVIGCTTGTG
jgi:hypothetical protein